MAETDADTAQLLEAFVELTNERDFSRLSEVVAESFEWSRRLRRVGGAGPRRGAGDDGKDHEWVPRFRSRNHRYAHER